MPPQPSMVSAAKKRALQGMKDKRHGSVTAPNKRLCSSQAREYLNMEFPCLFDPNGRWTGGVSFASCGAHVIVEAATLHSLPVEQNRYAAV